MIMYGPLTLEEVFDAYFDCRKHKRNTVNQLQFEAELEPNLIGLYRELSEGRYQIGRSVAFVVTHPKIREIWAAGFRDRIVHHIIYNRISGHFYRRFIRDSYACIPGRGVHDGHRRVTGFARSITRNWTRPAYYLKIDIANFFNSIDRYRLLEILERYSYEPWLRGLIRQVTLHDPNPGADFRSRPALFDTVPPQKSLRRAPEGKGLPIGNLTSQFFANVYLNEIDQFIKHELHVRYYGRYVDDMVLFHEDPGILNNWCDRIDGFLQERLSLHLHPRKKHLNRVDTGINFTGFIIKPGRSYLRQTTVSRCRHKIRAWERAGKPLDHETLERLSASVNSYLGMLRQVDGYQSRRAICKRVENLFMVSDEECTKVLVR